MTKNKLSRFQLLIIIAGCSGICINSLGLFIDNVMLSYIAIFIGRLTAVMYLSEVDKVRFMYFIPLGLSGVNAFVNVEQLIFLENLFQSAVYQIAAYKLFTSAKYNK